MAKPTENTAPEDSTNGLGKVVVRNEFYRDGYRSLLKIAVIQMFVILGLIGALYLIIQTNKPQNRYFATTEDGRLIPMVPLNQPNLSDPAILSWVAQASTEVMTFGFNDYRRRLQESSRNFTRTGWDSFTEALQKSRLIEKVEARQQVASAIPAGAPVIASQQVVAGRYEWIIELPLQVTYTTGNTKDIQRLRVRLKVVRVPRLESPSGIGIEQWIAFNG